MPILMNVNQLAPGMILAQNVIKGISLLIEYGRKLNQVHIDSLVAKFPDLKVNIFVPALDDIFEFQDNSGDQLVSQKIRSDVEHVLIKTKLMQSGVSLTNDKAHKIQRVISNAIAYLNQYPVSTAFIEQSHNLREHSVNVFFLSLLIGQALRVYIKSERHRLSVLRHIRDATNVKPLGEAALFHDLGMIPLQHLIHKSDPLTDEEVTLIKQHPHTCTDVLPQGIHALARQAVLMHHENMNGSGYPQGLAGEVINVLARIIRIADAFCASISEKPYRKAKSHVRTLYEMCYGSFRKYYDLEILNMFLHLVHPFAVGSKIKLKSGKIAVVLKYSPQFLFWPQVAIAYDKNGELLKPDSRELPFFLNEREDIKLASCEGEDISYLNDILPDNLTVEEYSHNPTYERYLDLVYP